MDRETIALLKKEAAAVIQHTYTPILTDAHTEGHKKWVSVWVSEVEAFPVVDIARTSNNGISCPWLLLRDSIS